MSNRDDALLSRELVAWLRADSEFAALFPPREGQPDPSIHPHLSGQTTASTRLTVYGAFEPYGMRRKGTAAFEIISPVAAEEDAAVTAKHADLVSALFEKLFGVLGETDAETRANQAAARTALVEAIGERGNVTITSYGPAREGALDADVNDEDLRTVVRIGIAWAFVAPAP